MSIGAESLFYSIEVELYLGYLGRTEASFQKVNDALLTGNIMSGRHGFLAS